jgi:hypothetical protein
VSKSHIRSIFSEVGIDEGLFSRIYKDSMTEPGYRLSPYLSGNFRQAFQCAQTSNMRFSSWLEKFI